MMLTTREAECLTLLAQGLSNAEIAIELEIGLPTVAMHIANAKKRLAARSREHAIALALCQGLIPGPDGAGLSLR